MDYRGMTSKLCGNNSRYSYYYIIKFVIVIDLIRSILTAIKSGEVTLRQGNGKEEVLINAGENLDKMCHSRVQKNVIAIGGRENRLKLFDLEKRTSIFSEKNLSHDWLGLRVPIWISDLNFLPGTQQIATAGRYGHVNSFIFFYFLQN